VTTETMRKSRGPGNWGAIKETRRQRLHINLKERKLRDLAAKQREVETQLAEHKRLLAEAIAAEKADEARKAAAAAQTAADDLDNIKRQDAIAVAS
jgi:membrane protein involved in colicin uptake